MTDIQSPRGTRDLTPDQQPYWDFVRQVVSQKAEIFGFKRIDLPTFEEEKIFTRAIGQTSDIVEKELFNVGRAKTDAKEDKTLLALRPEGTAGLVRAYIEHGMATWPQPVRLWYIGQMFRYDRPQKGRYREFYQMGVELIGDDSSASDALTILLSYEILTALGLEKDIILEINTLGDKECRPKIKKALTQYFSAHKKELCADCQRRLATNPLRLLDCKEEGCEKIKANAPQIIDLVDEACKIHFQNVLEYLDDLNVPYDLNPYLVRGLDYYTRTTLEIREAGDERRQNSLGGGGRYDGLIELYGGQATPAAGFALGLDRIVEYMQQKNVPLPEEKTPDVCIIQLGDKARHLALQTVKELTQNGFSIVIAPGKDALKGQLRLANKVKAKFALIIGQQEANEHSVIIKNLDDGAQETVLFTRLLSRLTKKLQ